MKRLILVFIFMNDEKVPTHPSKKIREMTEGHKINFFPFSPL